MDPTRFDELARALSAQPTRRGVLRLLAGSALGALLGGTGARQTAAQTCSLVGGSCAARACCAGARCTAAKKCVCKAGFTACQVTAAGGQNCFDLATDERHCGGCATRCTTSVANATAVCRNGQCGFACAAGFKRCNGTCIAADACCGGCTAPQTCGGGGTPGQCGCTPDCANKCGGAGDGCGGTCDATCNVCSGKDAPNPCFRDVAATCGTSGTGRTCRCGTDINGNVACYDVTFCNNPNPAIEGPCTSNADCEARSGQAGSICFSAENCCSNAPGVPATGCATPCPLPA